MTCNNAAHGGDPQDYCAACARDCEAELTALNDRYMRLLTGKARDQRATYAAARRTAQDEVRGVIGRRYLPGLDQLLPGIRPVLYRAAHVNPAWARNAAAAGHLDQLQALAAAALRAWDDQLDPERIKAEFGTDPREAEMARLRGVIIATGRRLHDQLGTPFDGFNPCECPGCSLIRDMDSAGLIPGPDDGPVSGPDGRRGEIIGGPDAAARVTVRWADGDTSEVPACTLTAAEPAEVPS